MTVREVTRKWRRFVFLAVFMLAVVFAIVTAIVSMYYAGEVIRPARSAVEPINKNIAFPYTSISFKSRDETAQLYGWHFNAKKTDRALIIVHGFGGNRFPFGLETIDLIETAVSADFNVLVFDMRNSGNAEEGISAFGLHEKYDVLGAVDYLRNAGYSSIAVLGVSTGANAAAAAGAMAGTDEIAALILDSPIVDTRNFVMRLVGVMNPDLPEFPFNYEIEAFTGFYLGAGVSGADAAVGLDGFMPRPVQLIYGNNDEIVSLEEITALYDDYMSRAVGKISIWYVQGAAHGDCFNAAKDEYLERVATFLRRVFT